MAKRNRGLAEGSAPPALTATVISRANFEKIRARAGCHQLLQQLNAQGYRCWLLTNASSFT